MLIDCAAKSKLECVLERGLLAWSLILLDSLKRGYPDTENPYDSRS